MSHPILPPASVCILRLSAIGDTCHIVPIVRRLQRAWPDTRLTWVIGRTEARLMSLLPGVEFITLDKSSGLAGLRQLRRSLRGRSFDVLLHMQLSLRASLASLAVHADRRIGFDRDRARELQWLFTNERIAPAGNQHVLDSFLGFLTALGLPPAPLDWSIPLPEEALHYAASLIPDRQPTLIVSPCSSHAARNWRPERYAAVIDHAVRRHGMRVLLCGGRSPLERDMGVAILQAAHVPVVNQIGADTLPQMLALLARATVLLSPDSGPVHMATLVGTPVIGLYAATRLARVGPYRSREWSIDRYAEAAQQFRHCPPAALPWHRKIEEPGVMDLIEVEAVLERLDSLLRAGAVAPPAQPPATMAP